MSSCSGNVASLTALFTLHRGLRASLDSSRSRTGPVPLREVLQMQKWLAYPGWSWGRQGWHWTGLDTSGTHIRVANPPVESRSGRSRLLETSHRMPPSFWGRLALGVEAGRGTGDLVTEWSGYGSAHRDCGGADGGSGSPGRCLHPRHLRPQLPQHINSVVHRALCSFFTARNGGSQAGAHARTWTPRRLT